MITIHFKFLSNQRNNNNFLNVTSSPLSIKSTTLQIIKKYISIPPRRKTFISISIHQAHPRNIKIHIAEERIILDISNFHTTRVRVKEKRGREWKPRGGTHHRGKSWATPSSGLDNNLHRSFTVRIRFEFAARPTESARQWMKRDVAPRRLVVSNFQFCPRILRSTIVNKT